MVNKNQLRFLTITNLYFDAALNHGEYEWQDPKSEDEV